MQTPSRGNLLLLYVVLFNFAINILISIAIELFQIKSFSFALVGFLLQYAGLFLPLQIYMWRKKIALTSVISFKLVSLTNLTLIFLMVVSITPFIGFLGSLSSLFFGNDVGTFIFESFNEPFYLIVLSICVAPALFEEFLMRGFVLNQYKNFGVKQAALMNGLLFAIFHFEPEQFLYTFFLGAVFVYFVHYTKSIWASVFAHFVFNFSQTAVSYSMYQAALKNGEDINKLIEPLSFSDQVLGLQQLSIVAICSFVLFAILFQAFISHNKRLNLRLEMQQTLANLEFEEEPIEEPIEEVEQEPKEAVEQLQPIKKAPKQNFFTFSFWCLIVIYIFFVALKFLPQA